MELLEGTAEAGFDGLDGNAQHPGDLRILEALIPAQNEDLAHRRLQLPESALDGAFKLLLLQGATGRRRRRFGRRLEKRRRLPILFPFCRVDPGVPRHRQQQRDKRPLEIEFQPVAPEAHEDLLAHVLRQRPVPARQAVDVIQDPRLVLAEEFAEGLRVARFQADQTVALILRRPGTVHAGLHPRRSRTLHTGTKSAYAASVTEGGGGTALFPGSPAGGGTGGSTPCRARLRSRNIHTPAIMNAIMLTHWEEESPPHSGRLSPRANSMRKRHVP